MRQDPEHFGEQELDLIYVAKRLDEALRLEQLLTEAGLDYLVEPDRYKGGVIFQTVRIGAFFYVAPADSGAARAALAAAGFRAYELG
jgi:hypothetical protein